MRYFHKQIFYLFIIYLLFIYLTSQHPNISSGHPVYIHSYKNRRCATNHLYRKHWGRDQVGLSDSFSGKAFHFETENEKLLISCYLPRLLFRCWLGPHTNLCVLRWIWIAWMNSEVIFLFVYLFVCFLLGFIMGIRGCWPLWFCCRLLQMDTVVKTYRPCFRYSVDGFVHWNINLGLSFWKFGLGGITCLNEFMKGLIT